MEPTRQRGTVLLAEDEPNVRQSVALILQRSQFEVISARTGTEALDMATSHGGEIRLLLADVEFRE